MHSEYARASTRLTCRISIESPHFRSPTPTSFFSHFAVRSRKILPRAPFDNARTRKTLPPNTPAVPFNFAFNLSTFSRASTLWAFFFRSILLPYQIPHDNIIRYRARDTQVTLLIDPTFSTKCQFNQSKFCPLNVTFQVQQIFEVF